MFATPTEKGCENGKRDSLNFQTDAARGAAACEASAQPSVRATVARSAEIG